MKQLIIIFALSVSFVMVSCDWGKKTFSRYMIVNDSDHEVILKSFDRESQTLQKTIQLLNKGDVWEFEKFETSEPGGGIIPPEYFFEGDSILVEFDAERVLIYMGTYSERNILYENNYDLKMMDDTNTVSRYYFTEADYENAEEIGG